MAFPGQYAPTPAEWKYPVWPTGCIRFEGDERIACTKRVEDFARARGLVTVTPELLSEIRRAMPIDFSKRRPFFLKDD